MALALIVDDVKLNRDVIGSLLRLRNWQVLYAESGEEALKIFAKKPEIDVIFTDLTMPGINGWELLKRLKEAGFKGVVIAVSGDESIKEKCIKAGFDGFLLKPLNPSIFW